MRKLFTWILTLTLMLCLVNAGANAATTIHLNKTTATLTVNDTLQLSLDGATGTIKWTTSNKSVASVSKTGLVKAKRAGNVTITAQNAKKKYTCNVTVKELEHPFVAETDSITLKPNQKQTIEITYLGSNKIGYKSGSSSIAKVEWKKKKNVIKAKITGKKAGTTTAQIYDKQSGKSLDIKITVEREPLSANAKELTIELGSTKKIQIYGSSSWTYIDDDIEDSEIAFSNWDDYNKKIIAVEGKAVGDTTLTIKDTSTGEKILIPISVVCTKLKIKMPELPDEVSDYSLGTIYKSYIIAQIDILEIEMYSSGYHVELGFMGRKSYDRRGAGQSATVTVGWKLYDKSGYVVDSGTAYGPSVSVGESWSSKACTTTLYQLQPGEYKLVILDTN